MSSQESLLLRYTKNEFVESMCKRIQAQTARGYPVLIMRQDNAGEKGLLYGMEMDSYKSQILDGVLMILVQKQKTTSP